MPTIKTIGSGKDYSTLQAWWDNYASVQTDANQWAECYGGSNLGALNATGTPSFTNLDATNHPKIYAASGNRWTSTTGLDTSKAYVFAGTPLCVFQHQGYFEIVGMQFKISNDTSTTYSGSLINANHGLILDGCFLENLGGTGVTGYSGVVSLTNDGNPGYIIVRNCYIRGTGNMSAPVVGYNPDGKMGSCAYAKLYNNTIIADGEYVNAAVYIESGGVGGDAGDLIIRNNIAVGVNTGGETLGCFAMQNNNSELTSFTNNIASDATPQAYSGSSNQSNAVVTDLFTNQGTGDYTLKSTSDAKDAGADLSGLFTTDGLGATRSGTWDIGAFEYFAGSQQLLAATLIGSTTASSVLRRFRRLSSAATAIDSDHLVTATGGTTTIFSNDLTNGSTTNASTYNTASVTPTANHLMLLWVTNTHASSAALPTVTGCSMTWVQVDTVVGTRSTGVSQRLTLFRAMKPSGITTGQITISFGGAQSGCAWSLTDVVNAETTGSDGADAIVQSVTSSNVTGSATSLTVNLANFASAANGAVACFATSITGTISPVGNWTKLAQATYTTPNTGIETQWYPTSDTTASASFSASNAFGIAVEVNAAPTYEPMASSRAASISSSAALRRFRRLAASATYTSDTTVNLLALSLMTAAVEGSASVAAVLRRLRRLTGTSSYSVDMSGDLIEGFAMLAAAIEGSLSNTAVVRRMRELAGSTSVTSDTESTLSAYALLDVDAEASTATTAVVRRMRELAATTSLTAASIATLTGGDETLAATIVASVAATSTLRRMRELSGATSVTADASGAVSLLSLLAASPQASTTIATALRRFRRLTGTTTVSGVAAAVLSKISADTEADHLYLEAKLLKHMFDLEVFTPPTTQYVAICETKPTEISTGSTIDEPTDPSYSRVAIGITNWKVNSLGEAINTSAINFPAASESWTGNYLVLLDAPTGGNILKYAKQVPALTVSPGANLTLPAWTTWRFRYSDTTLISTAWRRMLMQFVLNSSALGDLANLSLSLLAAIPGPERSGLDLEEVQGRNYYRVSLGVGSTTWSYDSETSCVTNDASITFPTATADWGTFPNYCLSCVVFGGYVALAGTFDSPKIVTSGSTLVVGPGEIKVRLRGDV